MGVGVAVGMVEVGMVFVGRGVAGTSGGVHSKRAWHGEKASPPPTPCEA